MNELLSTMGEVHAHILLIITTTIKHIAIQYLLYCCLLNTD